MFDRLFNRRESAASYSVCIVADDTATERNLITLLSDQVYTVYTASSGEKAHQVLDEATVLDVILVDLSLPEMNGPEFVKSARLRFGRAALPPILMVSDMED